jgi:PAS domain-containing protein
MTLSRGQEVRKGVVQGILEDEHVVAGATRPQRRVEKEVSHMPSGTSPSDEVGFSSEIAELGRRVALARDGEPDASQMTVLVQELETAVDELRVADEEVRAQQREVSRLLDDAELLRWRHERMLSVLPIPVLTTDTSGRLRSTNAAGAALFGIRVDHLLRKPIFAYVSDADRAALRTALSDVAHGGDAQRRHARFELRDHTVPTTVYVASSPESADVVTWLLMSAHESGVDHAHETPAALPQSLLHLFALSGQSAGPRDTVQQAAYVTAEALGPGVDVSVLLGSPRGPTVMGSTSQDAQRLDLWQLEAGEGPCVSAFDTGATVVSGELGHDERWTIPELDGSPLTAAVVVPLAHSDQTQGVLAAYLRPSTDPWAIVGVTEILAAGVSAVLQEQGLRSHIAELSDDMRAALASRSTIEQAKGVVMASKHCSADEAFHHLVMLSNTSHLKLREVAAQIVRSASD